jgi:hypothetical protein
VVACGRRFGKTVTGKIASIETAARGGLVWWVQPSYKMSLEVWEDLKNTLALPGIHKRENERRIDMLGGGSIEVRSAHDPDSLRGVGLDLVILDEAALIDQRAWTGAIRPALIDKNGKALLLSTPRGRDWFWGLWMAGQDPLNTEWESWRFPTSANPLIPSEEIEAARHDLPALFFSQEFLAEFLDDASSIFRRVHEAATAPANAQPIQGHVYVFGIDLARHNDYSVVAVFDASTGSMVMLDRFNAVDWQTQRNRIAALARKWMPTAIWCESNSVGEPNIEALQSEGLPVLPFVTTASSKPPLIQGLALAFEQGDIHILNDPVLIGELQAYTIERLPSGNFRYTAPPGAHDDTVMATAIGWHGVKQSRIVPQRSLVLVESSGLWERGNTGAQMSAHAVGHKRFTSGQRTGWLRGGKKRAKDKPGH